MMTLDSRVYLNLMKNNNASSLNILQWIRDNDVRTNKGLEVEFKDHGFLREFVMDTASKIVIRKGTQVGASYSVVIKILHLGGQTPLSIVYTMPTVTDAKMFVLSKFDPIIERSQGLRDTVAKVVFRDKPIYNSVVKRIGESYYFFRGSWMEHGAQSIDADVLVVDELDFQKPNVKNMWEERIEGSSSLGVIYWVGYPSIPGFGIEEIYESSDQRMWYIECNYCQKRQTLTWPDSIDFVKEIYHCKYCKHELTNEMRRRGMWKAKFPGREIHGYYINKLMAPWISAAHIINRFKIDTPKKFYNFTLGLPYLNKKSDITDEVISRNMVDEDEFMNFKKTVGTKVIVGIDQGDIFHMLVVLANSNGLMLASSEELRSEDDVLSKLKFYHPDICVMDMNPNRHTAKKLREDYGRDKLFMGNEKNWSENMGSDRSYFKLNRSNGEIAIERTESLDEMIELIVSNKIKFRRTVPKLKGSDKQSPGIIEMIKNLVPDLVEQHGKMRRVYKAVGPDHYGHALNFAIIGANILFPDLRLHRFGQNTLLAPIPEPIKKPWYHEDFERRVQSFAGIDSIIIKPEGRSMTPEDIFPRNNI